VVKRRSKMSREQPALARSYSVSVPDVVGRGRDNFAWQRLLAIPDWIQLPGLPPCPQDFDLDSERPLLRHASLTMYNPPTKRLCKTQSTDTKFCTDNLNLNSNLLPKISSLLFLWPQVAEFDFLATPYGDPITS
jgi:hypothetical protein